MSAANPLWGAPRIHGELRMLGIDVSERTVSRVLRRGPHQPPQTWRTFLANDVAGLVSMDFFTVPTVTGRVLFVLVLLAHQRRRIVHFAITEIGELRRRAAAFCAAKPTYAGWMSRP